VPFRVVVTKPALRSLEFIDRKHHRSIRDAILENLVHQPLIETRNRKTLDPAILGATWELRCGTSNRFRVLYEVTLEPDEETQGEVTVLLFGEKRGERLYVNSSAVVDLEEHP
jgi:hypothetical protein